MKKLLTIIWMIGIFMCPAMGQDIEEPERNEHADIRAYLKAQGNMMENFINVTADVDTPKKAAKALHLMVDDMEKIVPLIKILLKNHRDFSIIIKNPPPEANPEKKRIQNLSRDMAEAFDRMLTFKEDGYVKEALERLKQFQIDTRKMIKENIDPE